MRELAYQHIQKKIATRALKAGAPVSELAVAREVGVSRTPTREALRQLVAEGVLQEVPGRGVVVVKLDVRDIDEIYGIREALEVQAATKLAKDRVAGQALENLRKVAAEIAALADELKKSGAERLNAKQMTRFEAADIGFHAYMLQMSGNRRSQAIVSGLRALVRTVAMRRLGHAEEDLRRIHKDHADIVEAIADGNAKRTADVLSSHIQNSRRVRVEQFSQRERESELPEDITAFLRDIQADLG